jgi:hypothetical protein
MAAQIINVPMRAGGYPGVVGDARPQPAGAEGAAGIDAATGGQAHFTELADLQSQGFRNGQQQGVCAGTGVGGQRFRYHLRLSRLYRPVIFHDLVFAKRDAVGKIAKGNSVSLAAWTVA